MMRSAMAALPPIRMACLRCRRGRRWAASPLTTAVAGMLCFNFFLLPPFYTFTLADPQNWVALFAFLVTAVVASQLSASAKQRASEATRRQQEMERLYELSRTLMLVDTRSSTAGQ